ncbi:MAG: TIGR02186 family protein [Alphaproteobacteria bacterium]|jgi:uncharacterized protein (TIGR02186 family)
MVGPDYQGRRRRVGFLALALTLVAATLYGLAATSPPLARAATPLVADITDHVIRISTGFIGTKVVLFGSVEEAGDVVVLVRGPETPVNVHQKARMAGLWVNAESVEFTNAPSFYLFATTRPLDHILSADLRSRHRMGFDHLSLDPARGPATDAGKFRAALIALKTRKGLYVDRTGDVAFLGGRLFRTNIYFPADVPTGNYVVETYLVRDGEIVTAQTTPLTVAKIGLEAWLYRLAHQHPALYGLLAVFCAALAGWLGSWAFRRV